MDTLAKSEEYRGFTIETHYDLNPCESPRTWQDNFSRMITFHNRYAIGDDPEGMTPERLREIVNEDGVISLPIYLYDHSIQVISTEPFSCPWDSGQIGYIYITPEGMEEVGLLPSEVEKAENMLRAQVSEYSDYLQGNVYGVVVRDPRGKTVDSCWGYIGDEGLECGVGEMRSGINHLIDRKRRERQKTVKVLVSNRVPLDRRVEILSQRG